MKKEFLFAVRVWEVRKPIAPAASEAGSSCSSVSSNEKPQDIRLNSMKSAKEIGYDDY